MDTLRCWPCYGASFFPVCMEIPASGFFEYRTQKWVLGVNTKGAVIIDVDANVHKINTAIHF
jgi:hypothetical protein